MAELEPCPLGVLAARMFGELERERSIFDLPERRFFLGTRAHDLSVRFHGMEAATALGPAAGPQSQMAQNIVLSWLGGCRIHELKTVQVDDELVIPRPCIDMQTVGYNVEWSQELRLEESLEEYVKGSMLIEMLVASGELALAPGFERTLFDMSVGYSLAGIRSERVQAFIRGMLDCSEVVERLRAQVPSAYRDLPFTTQLSNTLTLSTFHGCPSDEIERILRFLLEENRLHCIVKLNPMLLGPERTHELLHDALGYHEIRVPDSAFEKDTSWQHMTEFVDRLGEEALALELGFGVKFTNTLVVENHRDFFPASEREMYLSGPPLHVLAMNLVRDFRRSFGDRFPISFSAGIDRKNFSDAVALGIVPVTVCSDLLKPGGYGRARGYLDELVGRMDAVGATCIDEFVVRAYGSNASSAAEAMLANTERYVEAATADARYTWEHNAKVPRKIGSRLELFDCITCDKCIPVCPNDANFTFALSPQDIPIIKVRRTDQGWDVRNEGVISVERRRQYANFADFCNDCGNCDVFCPEDGGPYLIKPRFFGSLASWRRSRELDGFHVASEVVHGRLAGDEFVLDRAGARSIFSGEGFRVDLDETDPIATLSGEATVEVDLTMFEIMRRIRDALLKKAALAYPSLLANQAQVE